ncbi:MAG: type II toxin-antitoxin system PemK/MazF family toxin [Candidatus Hydrothermarchaeales archaeon]
MPKNYSSFEEGDIVVLELPFTDLIGRKMRPVFVLSSKELNNASNDIIVAKISSSNQIRGYEAELKQRDLEDGRIKKTSYIHGHSIFTVEKHLIVKKIGRVNKKKLEDVKSIIKKALKI